jgi:uncharacterized SAM-binding protein YcdF (DUF218 family)
MYLVAGMGWMDIIIILILILIIIIIIIIISICGSSYRKRHGPSQPPPMGGPEPLTQPLISRVCRMVNLGKPIDLQTRREHN